MWREEEGTCGFPRFLYEHNRGCGLSPVCLSTKEYLQAHTFSWLHNDTLQYNYSSGKQCEVYIYYRGRNTMIYNMPHQ